MASSQICCCPYSWCILGFISTTSLELSVPQHSLAALPPLFFFSHVHGCSFLPENFPTLPRYSRNVPQTCQGLNTAVLWDYPAGGSRWDEEKEAEFGSNLVKGENNLWFWSKHPSFGQCYIFFFSFPFLPFNYSLRFERLEGASQKVTAVNCLVEKTPAPIRNIPPQLVIAGWHRRRRLRKG